MPADPSSLLSRNTYYKCVIRDILCHHSTCCNKSIAPDRNAADDGGIGADGGAATNKSFFIKRVADHLRAGVGDVGQDAGRAEEDVRFDGDAFIDRDIVLDLDVVAYDHVVADVDVLAKDATSAQFCAGLDVGEVPDPSAIANCDIVVDITGFVNEIVLGSHLKDLDLVDG